MEFDEIWKKIADDSIGRSASDIHLMEGGSVYLRVDGRLKKMDADTVLSREWMEDFLTASGGNVPDYSFEYGGRAFRVHAYTAAGKKMSPEKRAEYLKPFTLTSILKEEMMNLREENEGINIILKQANKSVKKDKFSAFEYGLYYIKIEEESKKKKKKFKITDMMFSS